MTRVSAAPSTAHAIETPAMPPADKWFGHALSTGTGAREDDGPAPTPFREADVKVDVVFEVVAEDDFVEMVVEALFPSP